MSWVAYRFDGLDEDTFENEDKDKGDKGARLMDRRTAGSRQDGWIDRSVDRQIF